MYKNPDIDDICKQWKIAECKVGEQKIKIELIKLYFGDMSFVYEELSYDLYGLENNAMSLFDIFVDEVNEEESGLINYSKKDPADSLTELGVVRDILSRKNQE